MACFAGVSIFSEALAAMLNDKATVIKVHMVFENVKFISISSLFKVLF
jgi:hypothetical protein